MLGSEIKEALFHFRRYPLYFSLGAACVLAVGQLGNKVLRNPTIEYCQKMSRSGDGSLEGIEAKPPLISLSFIGKYKTSIFEDRRLVRCPHPL